MVSVITQPAYGANNHLPIHQLPVELFTDIIEYSMQTRRGTDSLKRLSELATVSGTWCDGIENAPFLWSVVSSADSKALVKKALIKSDPHPLHIDFREHTIEEWTTLDFIALLLPHIARWKSLRYDASDDDGLSLLQGASVPTLETLWVKVLSRRLPTKPLDLFHGRPERLKAFHYQYFPLPWDYDQLKGLRKLTIAWNRINAPLPSNLFRILSNNPDLTSLYIGGLPDEEEGEAEKPIAPLMMPKLRGLLINGISCASLTRILPSLRAPSLDYLSVEIMVHQNNPDLDVYLDGITGHILERVVQQVVSRNLIDGFLELRVGQWSDFRCKMRLHPEERTYTLKWEVPDQMLAHVIALLPQLPDLSIKFVRTFFKLSDSWEVLGTLRGLETITSIKIENDETCGQLEPGGFARYLGTPYREDYDDEEELWKWPFPALDRLHFETNDDEDDLLFAMRRRNGLCLKREWAAIRELPVQMDYIYVQGINSSIRREIKRVVGKQCRVVRGYCLPASLREGPEWSNDEFGDDDDGSDGYNSDNDDVTDLK